MKTRIVISIAAALGIAGCVFAQGAVPATPPKVTAKERQQALEGIMAKLNLTAAQKAKIKAHAEEMKARLAEFRKTLKTSTPAERQAKMKTFREEQQAFLKATLTKTQLAEFQRLRAEQTKKLQSGAIKP